MTFPAQLEVNRLLRRETSSSQALAQSFDQSQSSVNLTDIPSSNENLGNTADEDIYFIGDARKRPKTARFVRDNNDVPSRVRPWSSPFRPCRSSRIVPRKTKEPTAGAVAATQPREETAVSSSLTSAFSGDSPRPERKTTQRKTSVSPQNAVDLTGDAVNQCAKRSSPELLSPQNVALESSNTPTLKSGGTSEVRSSSFCSTTLDLETEVAKNDKRLEARAALPVPTISVDGEDEDRSAVWHSQPNNTRSSVGSSVSQISSLERSGYVTERIHQLVTAFGKRASRVKAQITQPPTPSTELSDGEDEPPKPPDVRQRVDSPDPASRPPSVASLVGVSSKKARLRKSWRRFKTFCTFPDAIDPQGPMYIGWLLVVALCFTYNAWVVPLRSIFTQYQTPSNLTTWFMFDYLCDLIYLFDVVVIKTRIKYIDSGFWVKEAKLMRRHYIKGKGFALDVASLLPLDLLYLRFGYWSFFRLPRLFRMRCFWEFFDRLDSMLSSPHVLRVVRTLTYMLYLIHLNTCAYYGFSKIEGIGVNRWVFQGVGNAYIRCFYFATKTATSIGKNPKPENEAEYVFMTCSWLLGVFVFALLIGQIRDILATATRSQNEYQKVMDETQVYLHRLNVPPSLQHRVRLWFSYTWQNQKTLDEMRALSWLPKKMRMDLALHVHMRTLSKVQLFQDCDKALLRDLVLKLRPVLFLPGDYVCKKGEVGKEMYIVMAGEVQVKDPNDITLASLGQGSVFGEISLLALAGGNRRTADVRSRGFSNLFVLSKADLQATIKDYPEAQEILKKKAKRLIKQNEERERKAALSPDVIIKSRQSTPRILHTVLQVVRPDSLTADVIRRSSRYSAKSQCDLRSPGLPSWPSSSVTSPRPPFPYGDYADTDSRRSSLEIHNSRSKNRTSSLGVTSLSESFAEEEEKQEEEYLVVETTEVCEDQPNGSALSPVPASPRSQHSISLQRGSSGHSDASEMSRAVSACLGERGSCASTPQSVRSVSSSTPRSLGSTVRYSPMSLTRQAHVSSMEDLQSPEDKKKQGEKEAGKEEDTNTVASSLGSGSSTAQPENTVTAFVSGSSPVQPRNTMTSSLVNGSLPVQPKNTVTSSFVSGSSPVQPKNTMTSSVVSGSSPAQPKNTVTSSLVNGSPQAQLRDKPENRKKSPILLRRCDSRNNKNSDRRTSSCSSNSVRKNSNTPFENDGTSHRELHGVTKDGNDRTGSSKKGRRSSGRSASMQMTPGEFRASPRGKSTATAKGEDNSLKPTRRGSEPNSRSGGCTGATREGNSANTNRGSGSAKSQRKADLQGKDKTSSFRKPRSGRMSAGKGSKVERKPLQGSLSHESSTLAHDHAKILNMECAQGKINGDDSVLSPPGGKLSGDKHQRQEYSAKPNPQNIRRMTSSGEASPLLPAVSPDVSSPQQLSKTSTPDRQQQLQQEQQLQDRLLGQQHKLSRSQNDAKMPSVPFTSSSSSFESTNSSTVSCAAIVHREDASSLPRSSLPRPSETLRQSLLQERTPIFEAKQGSEESKL